MKENSLMKYKINWKLFTSVFVSIIIFILVFYLNNIEHNDAIYSSMFFIPLILVGLWYYRVVVPLSMIYAAQFFSLNYLSSVPMDIDHIIRGLILIMGSSIMYYLGRRINLKNNELIQISNDLAIEKELLKITFNSIGDGVICTDINRNITMINDVAEKITGWNDDSAIGQPFEEVFTIINELTREKCENIVDKVLNSGMILELANHTTLISKDGIEQPVEDSAAPIMNGEGKIVGAVLIFRDFSEKREKQKEIEFLSYHDQLTGLYNYRYYNDEISRIDRQENLPITIIMGDVDGLKNINDNFGHTMGDELLRKAAAVIKKSCRESDITVRLGGDEFVMILPKTDAVEAEKIIVRINELLMKEKAGSKVISVSFGYETKKNEDENIQEIFKSAENHMYKQKTLNHNSSR